LSGFYHLKFKKYLKLYFYKILRIKNRMTAKKPQAEVLLLPNNAILE